MPIGAPGKPTLVNPVRIPCWPVRNAARPAVQRGVQVLAGLRKPITDDKARDVLFGKAQYAQR